MKKVLIISPYFPPSNAPDMQRVRMSLPYFEQFGWLPEVVTVHEKHSHFTKDDNLSASLPINLKIHKVEALPLSLTKRLGLGSLALRSVLFYLFKVNKILKKNQFDLIYFSTTQFPVCILGRYWKKKFKIPYIIDMQDPWHSDYYKNKPKSERPPKYWFSYRLNKLLEPLAMASCDGLISVSQTYIDTLIHRYPSLSDRPKKVITFGVSRIDFNISKDIPIPMSLSQFLKPDKFNIIYVGVCGNYMRKSIWRFFAAFKKGLSESYDSFCKAQISFIGTSYGPNKSEKFVYSIAKELGVEHFVLEQTERISYYEVLQLIDRANLLFIPGSDDPGYTASKLYPYLSSGTPFISIFHPLSSVVKITQECTGITPFTLDEDPNKQIEKIFLMLQGFLTSKISFPSLNVDEFSKYDSEYLSKLQADLFNEVINNSN